MKAVGEQLARSAGLLRALEAATNGRAFVTLAGASIAFFLLVFVGIKMGDMVLIVLFTFIAASIVYYIGASATGILLMDEAKGLSGRSIVDALLVAVFQLHRHVAVFLIAQLAFLVYLLAVALVFFVCKIPGLGPLLYAIVFPAAALLTGLVFLAFFLVVAALAWPILWEGNTAMQTLTRLWSTLRQRLLMVVINLLLLTMLVVLVAGLVFGIVGIGTLVTGPMSLAIIGQSAGDFSMNSIIGEMMQGESGMGGRDASGYMVAGFFGLGVLWFVAGTIPALVGIKGICLIYLDAIEGLEFEGAEVALSQRVSEIKERAKAARERAMQAAPKPVATAQPLAPLGPRPASACPKCGAGVSPSDMFCESCGDRLG